MMMLFLAIAAVESGGNPNARNALEDAVGIVQIRRCVVDDVNRWGGQRFTYADRWDAGKSFLIFKAYLGHYGKGKTWLARARIWNGGPVGDKKRATLAYAAKVAKHYKPLPSK